MCKVRTWTEEQFISAVKKNDSIANILRELGLSVTGANYETVKRWVVKLDLDISHLKGRGHGRGGSGFTTKSLKEILVQDSDYVSTVSLKNRLLKAGILENKCTICGQEPEWNGRALVMVLDHIDGNRRNNRKGNLRLLCPNCNSQQKTFAGRNRKIKRFAKRKYYCLSCGNERSCSSKSSLCVRCIDRMKSKFDNETKAWIVEEAKKFGVCSMARKYGVSHTTIRRWSCQG